MSTQSPTRNRPRRVATFWFCLVPSLAIVAFASTRMLGVFRPTPVNRSALTYEERKPFDSSGFVAIIGSVKPWSSNASMAEIADAWRDLGPRTNQSIDSETTKRPSKDELKRLSDLLTKATLYNSEGETAEAAKLLEHARSLLDARDDLAVKFMYTIIHFQGVTALRQGENDNCIMCRGESSCILPIAPAARHAKPEGSRKAIGYFTEYLKVFPDDLEVKWLLNVAHMTLGEYPDKVDARYLVSLDRYNKSEFDIGKFRDVGEQAGVNRFNQAGGAIMEDFDGDGWLDLATTTFDPTQPMAYFRNRGDGTFEDRSEAAGVLGQLGGQNCVQTDYDNDGRMDIFIPRGGWLSYPMRPSLLHNEGGKFVDVTEKAGLLDPVNSISACWADYDNDGWLDLFICCEKSPNRLYHNQGDGTFVESAGKAGVAGDGQAITKGAAWIDFDNDGDPDLFLTDLRGVGRLLRNQGSGTFEDLTLSMGIDGPRTGFSCWAWDYDNDGWLDLFATCYERTVADVVKGLIGQPHSGSSNKLFHNLSGEGFEDVTKQAGLDLVFATMGSNFADFDNDGFLDFYLGTGDPHLSSLVPNRMFKNVDGKRFAEITASSGTGHLQKGHGVACGDYDRDGDVDLFIEMGGAVKGDMYRNVLFENPGQGNHWLTVKLVGKKTNRAAIGARLKIVTAGEKPMTVHRHVSSGSSYGANSLRQHVGLAGAKRVASLEVHWPTSGTTQVFHDVDADQTIEITEFEQNYRKLDELPSPKRK
jgi:ASPIC and UnbV/FG-GAP-like repeat